MTEDTAALAGRVSAVHGRLVALDLPGWASQALIEQLRNDVDIDALLVLGRACTTAPPTLGASFRS